MSHDHEFDPECEGCQPVILDPVTGKKLPADHPVSVAALKVWREMTRAQQEALNRIWVHNSRDPEDLAVAGVFQQNMATRLGPFAGWAES